MISTKKLNSYQNHKSFANHVNQNSSIVLLQESWKYVSAEQYNLLYGVFTVDVNQIWSMLDHHQKSGHVFLIFK